MSSGVRIVYNKLLRGWYIVRGPHQTPLSGRFDTQGDAQRHLLQQQAMRDARGNYRKGN
jgi:hypothetical protein